MLNGTLIWVRAVYDAFFFAGLEARYGASY